MKIFCKYSDILDKFLNEVVQYTLNLYSEELDISEVEEIELMSINEFNYDTDGRTYDEGRKILVTSRLYDKLPHLDISRLEDNEEFKMIVNTMFHEMGHATDWKKFPHLYYIATESDNKKDIVVSLFWLEYLAEKRSNVKCFSGHNEFCIDFVSREWKAYRANLESSSEENYFYLNKLLAYFMGRTTEQKIRNHYLNMVNNSLLKEYILEIGKEISYLEEEYPFDDVSKLYGLYDIMNKYYKKFQIRYKPRLLF